MDKGEQTATVIVVNWNGGELLETCIDSVCRATAHRRDIEILVVDNASSDSSATKVVARHPQVRLIERTSNGGFAVGVNTGIAASTAPFIVLLNNDAVAAPDFIDSILAPFRDGDRTLAAVTGKVLLAGRYRRGEPGQAGDLRGHDGAPWLRVPDDEGIALVNSTGNEVTRSANGRDRDWLALVGTEVGAPAVFGFNGGAAALRREALEDVGVFREDLFMYYEDTELSWRLRRRGWRIEHAPDAVTWHQHAASSGTSSEFFLGHNARNRLIVALIHAPAPVIVRGFLRTVVRMMRGPHRGLLLGALGYAARRVPACLAARREVDRMATVPRATVAQLLVAD